MFLNRLERHQREAFLTLAHEIVCADSVTTVGEVAQLAQFRRELGLDSESDVHLMSVDDAARAFDSGSARVIAMLELMNLCCADRRFSVLEEGLIKRLGTLWRMNPEVLEEAENWVFKQRKLLVEAHEMIARGGRSGAIRNS